MRATFTRADVSPRHYPHATPACLAHHLFLRLPLLERVAFDGATGRVFVRIHLHRRAWWRFGIAHWHALRIAIAVVFLHKAAGVIASVRLD